MIPTRRILTGEGMSMVEQLRKCVVPCPTCFKLCPIEGYKVRVRTKAQKRNNQPARRVAFIHCHTHGDTSVSWDSIVHLIRQRQERLDDCFTAVTAS